MAIKGMVITDPASGASVEFLETAADSGGQRVVILHTIPQKGRQVPNHRHAFQSETFEVVEGTLTCWAAGQTKTLSAGEKVTFPAGTLHNHWNAGAEKLVYRHTTEPALDFEYLIENLMGLTIDGRIKNGKVRLLQALVTQHSLESKAYLAFPPVPVQKVMAKMLTPLAHLLGYRAIYAKYSGFQK
jgi:quercetin dioxygenase-like cupin family protein